eukprot:CAMPEP_0181295754 /NCGR_PEP_ID=MMETSP1101-20121128/4319_1 /TAXON_ID=46948 /ORGANISM="Rhodomonas abbreviata, Strain Caron Lab Isolate" /LENGTH=123 /DNA_ID=CAMNT_0023400533 /DNA_START=369 /DNA_END=737 /DNA_ORIENTATION=-
MHSSSFRTTSPAPGSQPRKATPTRGSSSGSMLKAQPSARQTPRSLDAEGSSQASAAKTASKNVQAAGGNVRRSSPVSGYGGTHKSPVSMERMTMERMSLGDASALSRKGRPDSGKPRLTQGTF